MALDPPRRRLQHGIAYRTAKGGVDRVVAADREQQHDDRPGIFGPQPLGQPGARRAAVAKPGQRVAARPGARLDGGNGFGTADDPAFGLDPDMVGNARAFIVEIGMGERGRLAGRHDPHDRAASGAPAFRVELAEQVDQADPAAFVLAESRLARERRAQLDGARTRLPAPGIALAARLAGAARAAAADPLGMAQRELEGVEELRLGEGADQEMGGAKLVEAVQRAGVVARQQDEQGGGIGLGGIGDRPHRFLAFVERAAGVDDRHRRAGRDEPCLRIFGPARRDRLPAGALGQSRQLVAMAKGEDEERRTHRLV